MNAESELQRKWDSRYAGADPATAQPARVLTENTHLLPSAGCALEVACGLGANAVLLAQNGLATTAWDISPVAIEKLTGFADDLLTAEIRDVIATPPPPESYDVLVVTRFLERRLCPALIESLRPGGLLFYQTFTRDAIHPGGPTNSAHRLARGELLQLFAGLTPLVYRDEGLIGDTQAGMRDEAMLVAVKR